MIRARTVLRALALATGLAGCTPAQLDAWIRWYETDPTAAVEFASRPEVQARLHQSTQAESKPALSFDLGVWDRLAECESGQTWDYNGRSGFDGGLQFAPSTWRAYGGEEFASHAWGANREQQIAVAERVLADVGWRAWPTCSRKLGLR